MTADEGRADFAQMYARFAASRQEAAKLALALEGFFHDPDTARRERYGQYLRRRLQPAAAALIAAENTAGLARLAEQGWFDARLTDRLIRTAREQGRTEPLIWLLRFKGARFGYADRDFSL